MPSYKYLNDEGQLEEVDLHSGEVRVIHDKDYVPAVQGELVKTISSTGETVWVSKHISFADLRKLQGGNAHYPYSILFAEVLCAAIAEGATLKKISDPKSPYFVNGCPPYNTLAKWRRENPEFQEMYKQALEDRAEVFFDKMQDAVESANDEDDVAVAKLRSDFYKYAAKVGAPNQFAEVQKIDAKMAIGVAKIETGIRRHGDSGFEDRRIDAIEKEFNLGGKSEERVVADVDRSGVNERGDGDRGSDSNDRQDPLGVTGDALIDGGSVRVDSGRTGD